MGLYTWRNWRDTDNVRKLGNVREHTSYAIQSQYSASKRILAVAKSYQTRINPKLDIKLFYDKMFNILTAEGFGLDNWGEILQRPRSIRGPYNGKCFGFLGSFLHPFDDLPFAPDTHTKDGTYITLDDELYRLLLLYKALANISASDAATQNKLLSVLIDTGIGGFKNPAYVLEIDTMVIRWVFESHLTTTQRAIFEAVGTLARGAGVGWQLLTLSPSFTFGFAGQRMQPFNQAVFTLDNILLTPHI